MFEEIPRNSAENEERNDQEVLLANNESIGEKFAKFKEKEFLAQESFLNGIEDEPRRKKAEILVDTFNAMEEIFWSIDRKHNSLEEQ